MYGEKFVTECNEFNSSSIINSYNRYTVLEAEDIISNEIEHYESMLENCFDSRERAILEAKVEVLTESFFETIWNAIKAIFKWIKDRFMDIINFIKGLFKKTKSSETASKAKKASQKVQAAKIADVPIEEFEFVGESSLFINGEYITEDKVGDYTDQEINNMKKVLKRMNNDPKLYFDPGEVLQLRNIDKDIAEVSNLVQNNISDIEKSSEYYMRGEVEKADGLLIDMKRKKGSTIDTIFVAYTDSLREENEDDIDAKTIAMLVGRYIKMTAADFAYYETITKNDSSNKSFNQMVAEAIDLINKKQTEDAMQKLNKANTPQKLLNKTVDLYNKCEKSIESLESILKNANHTIDLLERKVSQPSIQNVRKLLSNDDYITKQVGPNETLGGKPYVADRYNPQGRIRNTSGYTSKLYDSTHGKFKAEVRMRIFDTKKTISKMKVFPQICSSLLKQCNQTLNKLDNYICMI